MTTRGRTRFSRLQNKQLVNNGMVCVLHWYPLNAETVTFGHFAHLWRIVVSHHHCTAHLRHECKQSFVVDFVVCIEPGPRLLASGRIRRVNEKEGIGIIGKAAYNLEGISRSKTIRFLRLRSTLMRVASVSGYQRDLSPRPASPSFTKPAPAAMMPPLCIRFLMMVRKAWFLVERGFPLSTARTFSEVTSKRVIFLDRSATSTSVP